MQELKHVSKYCVRVKDMVNKKATLGKIMIVKKVLRTLTFKWNHITIIIIESNYLTTYMKRD